MAKVRTGVVISNKMDKTAVVRVDRMVPHKKYGKRYRVTKRFAAHDETNSSKIGDIVKIQETRPLSKSKQWKIIARIGASETPVPPETPEEGISS